MSATVHKLTQGSAEWLEYRLDCFNASEASAMLGISPYKSREELLEEKATGITPEVNKATQAIFDEGHRLEAQARPKAEEIIGEDLFTPTMSKETDGMKLSASFDGLTILDDVVWEHKTLNKNLKENLSKGIIPESYKPQLEQMLLISGASEVLFMASNDEESLQVWYEKDDVLRKRIINGWKQFKKDLANWKPTETNLEVIAEKVEELPTLNIEISGGVKSSNLAVYEKNALAFIKGISTDLQTDSDFANADALVKFCSKTEAELKEVKQAALDQTGDISALFKTIDNLSSEMRSKRLELDKLVKARKAAIKDEIINEAITELSLVIVDINKSLHKGVVIPYVETGFPAAAKNKRTIKSLQNAINTELARCKIAANEMANHITDNMHALDDLFTKEGNYQFLFSDIQDFVMESAEAFTAIVRERIAAHKAAEQKRLDDEREKIRLEEEAKAKAAAEQKVLDEVANKTIANAEKINNENEPNWCTCEGCGGKVNDGDTCPCSKPDLDDLVICDMHEQKPDHDYFRNQMGIILMNLDNYTKDELRTAFTNLADAV